MTLPLMNPLKLAFRRLLPLLWMAFLLAPALLPCHLVAQENKASASRVQTSSQSSPQAYNLPPEKLQKAITLGHIRHTMHFVSAFWEIGLLVLLLASGLLKRINDWCEQRSQRRIWQSLLFFGIFTFLLSASDLPLAIFSRMVGLHYGLSVQSWGGWIIDLIKSLAVEMLLTTPLLALFYLIVRKAQRRYWLYAWLVMLPLMVLGVFLSPVFFAIFNKFEPLSKQYPQLVTQIERVAARTGTAIPPERIFLMKASEKTNTLNAYVTGLGSSKRIVVWDTTAGRISNDEIIFIFAHESGHYVLNHVLKGMVGGAILLFFVFWATAPLTEALCARFGTRWGMQAVGTRVGLVLLILVLSAVQFVLEPVSSAWSRHIEHEADVYGQEAVHGIVPDPQQSAVRAFNDLGAAALDDPNPSSLVEFWFYSHPSLQHRAGFALSYDPWKDGAKPQFFSK